MGHDLEWFEDKSQEYIFPHTDGFVEDYGTNFDHTPSMIEAIGNIVYSDTGDFSFATKIVVALAYKTGVQEKLRKTSGTDFPHMYGDKYVTEIGRWSSFFESPKQQKEENCSTD
jgi:hypothetical protein